MWKLLLDLVPDFDWAWNSSLLPDAGSWRMCKLMMSGSIVVSGVRMISQWFLLKKYEHCTVVKYRFRIYTNTKYSVFSDLKPILQKTVWQVVFIVAIILNLCYFLKRM